jgi:glycerol-3-phosphate acyltransferase PlsY
MKEPLLVLLGFVCGSVPFGLLIGLAKGVDIRAHGSGNIGATNVGRVLGRKFFFLCFGLDFLKGFAPTLGAGAALGALGEPSQRTAWWWLAVMAASVLGHIFSPWLKFRGGKGVATGLGALLAVFPFLTIPGACSFLVWLAALAAWRYISVSSMLAGLTLPAFTAAWIWATTTGPLSGAALSRLATFSDGAPFLGVSAALAVLVVWTHRGNLRRLRAGTEPRVGERAK